MRTLSVVAWRRHELATAAAPPEAGRLPGPATVTPRLFRPLPGESPVRFRSDSDPVSLLLRPSLRNTTFCCRERRFPDSLRNAIWQVDFLRTCRSGPVFITLILVLWSARYKILNWLDVGKGPPQGHLAHHSAAGLGGCSVTCFCLRKLLDFSDRNLSPSLRAPPFYQTSVTGERTKT